MKTKRDKRISFGKETLKLKIGDTIKVAMWYRRYGYKATPHFHCFKFLGLDAKNPRARLIVQGWKGKQMLVYPRNVVRVVPSWFRHGQLELFYDNG